jgi:hypothetical protein
MSGKASMTQPPDGRLACLLRLEDAAAELRDQISQFTMIWAAPAAAQDRIYGRERSVRRRLEMVEQLSKALHVLNKHGQFYRRAEAQALYAEGLTMAELASVFQVSRQRIAMLLREPAEDSALP